MALLTSTVLTEIKGLLNDPTGSIYPDIALIPILNKAYRELQTKLAALGVSVTKEVSDTVQVLVGVDFLGDGAGLPDGFLQPIEIGERLLGSDDRFSKVDEREWEPNIKKGNELLYWTFREETLYFPGANTPRELLMRYFKSLPAITDGTTPIYITDGQTWLAQRTGALAALLIGHNPSRAEAMITDLYGYNGPWEDLKALRIKRMQNIPVRRRRTRWRIP
jgi:hypothetical protein